MWDCSTTVVCRCGTVVLLECAGVGLGPRGARHGLPGPGHRGPVLRQSDRPGGTGYTTGDSLADSPPGVRRVAGPGHRRRPLRQPQAPAAVAALPRRSLHYIRPPAQVLTSAALPGTLHSPHQPGPCRAVQGVLEPRRHHRAHQECRHLRHDRAHGQPTGRPSSLALLYHVDPTISPLYCTSTVRQSF